MKKIPPRFLPALTLLLLPVLLFADKPIKQEDPNAGKNHAVRGSEKEKKNFKKHSLKSAKPASKSKKSPKLKHLPKGAEVRKSLGKNERPSKRFLKQGKAAKKFPQHQNKLENKNIRHPKDFEVTYKLDADADVTITVFTTEDMPIARTDISAGNHGAKKGSNKLSIWDGQDFEGRDLPMGDYYAMVDIDYASHSNNNGNSAKKKESFTRLRFSLSKK